MDDWGRPVLGCIADAAIYAYRWLKKTGESDPYPCSVSMTADGTDIVIGATPHACDSGAGVAVYTYACGPIRMMAGEAIDRGDWIAAGADGKSYVAESGDYVCAYALHDASGDGVLFDVLPYPSIPYDSL